MSFEDEFVLPPRYAGRATSRTATSRSSSVSSSADTRSSGTYRGAKPRVPHGNPFLQKRVLPITEYADELRHGPIENLSIEERIRLYGSEIVPIPVPLEPGEREVIHEKRFRGWIAKRRIDMEKQTVTYERKLRIDFAKLKTHRYDGGSLFKGPVRGAKRRREEYDDEEEEEEEEEEEAQSEESYQDDEDAEEDAEEQDDDVVHTKRQRVDGHSDLLLRQRVLSIDQFRAELERDIVHKPTPAERLALYGSTTMPVPVPLFPGETVEVYERAFLAHVLVDNTYPTRFRTDPNAERSARFSFARYRINHPAPFKVDPIKRSSSPVLTCILERVGDAARTVRMDTVKTEPRTDPPLPQVKNEDGSMNLTQSPPKCSLVRPSLGSSNATLLRALLACGCRACWLQCTHSLVNHLDATEKAAAISETLVNPVMDITRDGDGYTKGIDIARMVQLTSLMKKRRLRQSTTNTKSPGIDRIARDDPIERQLQAQYDELNTRVVENQRAVTHLSNQLQATAVDHVDVAAALQTERYDLERLIEDEMDNRNAALAMLAVYMWRNDKPDLAQRIQSPGASNVGHVQLVCHLKCATIATELTHKRHQTARLKRELDAVLQAESASMLVGDEDGDGDPDADRLTKLQHVGEQLTHVEQSMGTLHTARKREITTLIHFDAHVRELVETLLLET